MSILSSITHPIKRPHIHPSPVALFAAVMVTLAVYPLSNGFAQEAFTDEAGTEVLTRGPIHEAFAGVISYDPLPGVVVAAAPPELIEEIPPGERPVGDDVTWIPGYWAWDDERNDFLWVSGIWRALPPGREWIVGYWAETTAGYQWTSGYWADAVAEEITYLPAPPGVWRKDPISKHHHRTMVGRPATGFGARSVMPGVRATGRRFARIGIGCPHIMSGHDAVMSLLTDTGTTRCNIVVFFSRRSILTGVSIPVRDTPTRPPS